MESYSKVSKTPDWQFLQDAIVLIKGQMAVDMFSSQYTNLSPEEKDLTQKIYFYLNEILTFFANPASWVNKRQKIGGNFDARRKHT